MAQDAPLVTVVTPTLNQAGFLEQTILSVISQDYPQVEYIVADGGSTDQTKKILQKFSDQLVWISQEGLRQSEAINTGWSQGKGEILAWLNSDDFYLPGAISAAVSHLQMHKTVGAVYGDCSYIDDKSEFLSRYPTQSFNYPELVRTAINYIPQPATFIRRAAWELVGGLDENLEFIMDFDLWLRIGKSFALTYVPQDFASLRLHPGAKSLASLESFGPELIRVYQRYFTSQSLPQHIRGLQSEAMSRAFYIAADSSFWAGRSKRARKYALEAMKIHPRSIPKGLLRLLVLSMLGDLGQRFAVRRYPNPYFGPFEASP